MKLYQLPDDVIIKINKILFEDVLFCIRSSSNVTSVENSRKTMILFVKPQYNGWEIWPKHTKSF